MKRTVAFLLLVAVLVLALPFLAQAQDLQSLTDDRGRFVDIVIIVDHSSSMRSLNSRTGNDPQGNRYVASAMITAMSDMNGSRVAFVPFDRDLLQKESFVDLSSFSAAESLRSQISTYARKSTKGGTDYGSALAYAYNLFATRDDEAKSNNNPMIILLTDGDNDLRTGASTAELYNKEFTYLWNSATNLYEEVPYSRVRNIRKSTSLSGDAYFQNLVYYDGTPVASLSNPAVLNSYDKAAADMLVNDVARRCQQENIPIYTIPLYNSAERSAQFISLLQQISQMTGALSNPISSNDADRLPFFFGDVFADQIGSSQRLLNVRSAGDNGLLEVDIPLLNRSVQEANIYIPLTYVDAASIRLIDSDGRDRIPDNNEIIRIAYSDTFVFYKLRATSPLGNWRLQFRAKSDDVAPSDINFSLLYNYDITLVSTVNGTASGLTLSKSDTLSLVSSFYDNKTQAKSTDAYLYEVRPSPEDTIRFTYRLLDSTGMTLADAHAVEGEMTLDPALLTMNATVDLRGYDLLSGNYYLQIIADGAGLHRENLIPLTLENAAPVVRAPLNDTLNVEYPDDPATYAPQDRGFDLTSYIDDPDGDVLYFSNMQITGGDGILTMAINGQTLNVGTRADASTGHYLYGVVSGTIDVSDDDAGTCQLGFTITVNSGWAMAQDCDYHTTVTGLTGPNADIADKNSDIFFSMTPVSRATGTPQGVGLIAGRLSLLDAASGQEVMAVDMTPTAAGDALEGTLRTTNTAASWIARCEYFYNGESVASEDFPITVTNTPPVAISASNAAAIFPRELTYNPSIYASFVSEMKDAAVDLTQLFTDPDNEAGLVYAVTLDNPDNADKLDCHIDGNSMLVMSAISAGKVSFTVTATDGDGAVTPFRYTLRVVNLFVRWTIRALILLLIIVAIILLLLAIRQHNKPAFPENGSFHVTIGSALFDRNTQPDFSFHKLRKPKEPITLNSVITLDTSEAVQFKHAELGNIRLLPVKASNELRVEMTKTPGSFIVRVDDSDAKQLRTNNPLTIMPNHELTLYPDNSTDNEKCVHIIYSLSANVGSASPYDEGMLSFTPDSPNAAGDEVPMGEFSADFGGLDAGFGSAPDAGFGSVPDMGFGAAPDAGFGAAPDMGFGNAPDAGFGAAPDAGFGATPDAGFGSAPDSGFGNAPDDGFGSGLDGGFSGN